MDEGYYKRLGFVNGKVEMCKFGFVKGCSVELMVIIEILYW